MAQFGALALVVWLLILPKLRGSSGSLPLLWDLDGPWVPIALAAEVGSLVAYTLATRSMLSVHVRPPYRRVACIDLSSIALGHCLPDGGAAGTALSWRLLVRAGVPGSDAAFAKFAQGLGSAVMLYFLLFTSLVAGGWDGGYTKWSIAPITIAGIALAVVTLVILSVRRPGFRESFARILSRIPRIGHGVAARTAGLYERHLEGHIRTASRDYRRLVQAAVWSLMNWGLDFLALWASLTAFDSDIRLEGVAVAFTIACIGTWLPITPSGVGITEGLMIPALIAFGASQSAAVVGVLTWRAIAYWMPIPIGAVAYGALHLDRRAPRVPAPVVAG
ncbi:MAG TPA: lysylphosphatidylglycerol synthase transmembrane domain-containing protein [Mycobacteriales bacterium]|nr:lysylphosphatidylglycerol synthase transmembrane domain-containing protein [Mycobacteriales bacterium]